MEQWRGKVALVTGASSGIGYELIKQLAGFGMNVVGCAKEGIEKIEQLSSEVKVAGGGGGGGQGEIVAVKCDIANEENIKTVYEVAKKEFGGVDVCVNNAGVGHNAPLLSGATSEWRDMLEVNVLGVCVCTREFMSQLKERGIDEGHIILLNSMSGHRVGEATSVNLHFYAATKFAVTALTEGIRQELRDMKSNIKVSSFSPGLVTTPFHGQALKVDTDKNMAELRAQNISLEVEDVASAIVYALSCPPHVQIHEIQMRSTHQKD